jgi:pyrroline-5-carboxylate reductase
MNLLFLGGGNMANALISGLATGDVPLGHIHVLDPVATARDLLEEKFKARFKTKNISFTTASRSCPEEFSRTTSDTWVILAVKPQQMQEACQQADPSVQSVLRQAQLISIAAGIRSDSLAAWCQNKKIIRAMPNTPALVNHSVTGLYAAADTTAATRETAGRLMSAVGSVVWVTDESLMDVVTAVSGSGPAYVFRFIEALTAAGEALGLTQETAAQLSIQTLEGALALLKASDESPASLRGRVTSKGGTTAAALASLDQHQFMTIIAAAVKAARDRGEEMAKEFK